MYWVPIISVFDENLWKSLSFWFLFLLSKLKACNLWNGGGKKFVEKKKKSLSSLKQSNYFPYSQKRKLILVSACMCSYYFVNKIDPQNTNAKGNSWADGKGKK